MQAFTTRRNYYMSTFNCWIECEASLVQAAGHESLGHAAFMAAQFSANQAGLRYDPESTLALALSGGEPYALWA